MGKNKEIIGVITYHLIKEPTSWKISFLANEIFPELSKTIEYEKYIKMINVDKQIFFLKRNLVDDKIFTILEYKITMSDEIYNVRDTLLNINDNLIGTLLITDYDKDEAQSDANNDNEEINYIDIFLGMSCLIVDDVDLHRMIVKEMLSETGIEIFEASNGLEAYEKYLKNDYDIILMDINMPIMDGYAATRAIRESNEANALSMPIIALNASTSKDDIALSAKNGMSDHISKPIELYLLIHSMKKHLLNNKMQNDATEYSLNMKYLEKYRNYNGIDIDKAIATYGEEEYAKRLNNFAKHMNINKIYCSDSCEFNGKPIIALNELLQHSEKLFFTNLYGFVGKTLSCLKDNNINLAKLFMGDVIIYSHQILEIISNLVILKK